MVKRWTREEREEKRNPEEKAEGWRGGERVEMPEGDSPKEEADEASIYQASRTHTHRGTQSTLEGERAITSQGQVWSMW